MTQMVVTGFHLDLAPFGNKFTNKQALCNWCRCSLLDCFGIILSENN